MTISQADLAPWLGIDTGGTFTDFVCWHQGELRVHKVLSTPEAPEQAILQGIEALGFSARGLQVIHGSTVATNALLEGKGVRVAYITNRGFGDVLRIGRQTRRDLYDLQPPELVPPVPEEYCLETGGRLAADGRCLEPLTDRDRAALRDRIKHLAPQAVAVNLLFSYLDDRWEREIAQCLPPNLFVSCSSQVLPLVGEYERGIATWLNAYVGPIVQGYLQRLCRKLPGTRVGIMQSSGEVMAAEQASDQAVRLLLSGPAGGLMGAGWVGEQAGAAGLLSFDMGGTSTDVALIEGSPRLTTAGQIAGYPVAVPMVDLHTIGAGGGSIARLDAGGALLVGPESAGADPGPACYGQGGQEPTVTDAHVVLGHLPEQVRLGGHFPLKPELARAAVGRLAQAMGGVSGEEAAAGILRLTNEHMAQALRVISVQRGLDPRDYTLTAFGGAGGLHVCALADALEMTRAMVPLHAGVLSALGMLAAPPGRQLIHSWQAPLSTLSDRTVDQRLQALADQGRAALAREGWAAQRLTVQSSVDLRYRGQSHSFQLPWQGVKNTRQAFHAAHEARYGHALSVPVELVNLRVQITAPPPSLRLPKLFVQKAVPQSVPVVGCGQLVPLLTRQSLGTKKVWRGPAIILDPVATTWLAPGWKGRQDAQGTLHLFKGKP